MIAILEAQRAGLLRRENWLPNIVAGVIVGVVALPLAMAFAIATGAKPEQGLYTAIIAALVVSLFGGSRVQIAGSHRRLRRRPRRHRQPVRVGGSPTRHPDGRRHPDRDGPAPDGRDHPLHPCPGDRGIHRGDRRRHLGRAMACVLRIRRSRGRALPPEASRPDPIVRRHRHPHHGAGLPRPADRPLLHPDSIPAPRFQPTGGDGCRYRDLPRLWLRFGRHDRHDRSAASPAACPRSTRQPSIST